MAWARVRKAVAEFGLGEDFCNTARPEPSKIPVEVEVNRLNITQKLILLHYSRGTRILYRYFDRVIAGADAQACYQLRLASLHASWQGRRAAEVEVVGTELCEDG